MSKRSVQTLLEDIRLVSEHNVQIVEAVRGLVRKTFAGTSEEVKYGGILFSAGVPFAGVFAYQAHVTVEFGSGAKIVDTYGCLEGAGKGRRHIKLLTLAHIEEKKLAEYLPLALRAAQRADS